MYILFVLFCFEKVKLQCQLIKYYNFESEKKKKGNYLREKN